MGRRRRHRRGRSDLIFSEQFFSILIKADEDDHGRPDQADKEHNFKQPHCKNDQLHKNDSNVFSPCAAQVCRPPAGKLGVPSRAGREFLWSARTLELSFYSVKTRQAYQV